MFASLQDTIFIENQVAGDVITTAAVKVPSVTVTKFLHLSFISVVYKEAHILIDLYTGGIWLWAAVVSIGEEVRVNHFPRLLLGEKAANTRRPLSLL